MLGGLCVAALVIGYSGYHFARGVQFGAGQVARATAWDVILAVVGIAGVLVALAAGLEGPAILLPLAAAYGVYAAAGWPGGAGSLAPDLRRGIDGFVGLGVAGTMASAGFLQLSMVAARLAGTPNAAGQYAAALTLPRRCPSSQGPSASSCFPPWPRRGVVGTSPGSGARRTRRRACSSSSWCPSSEQWPCLPT